MSKQSFKQLTKAEKQVMHALWQIEKGTTHQIIDLLEAPKPHYNTISTILKILHEKEFIRIESVGKTNLYFPLVSKENYSKGSIREMLSEYFGGSFSNMLSAFSKEKDIDIKALEAVLKEMKKNK